MRAALRNALVVVFALISSAALADDWTADKLRGPVLQLVDGQWQKLNRGMVVPDTRVIRTLGFGYVTFTRGGETIDLGPNTQIQIFDKGGRKPFTTVQQSFGTVSIEANVENVQHFAVQTQYLAAVVKGTRFTVTSGKTGSRVEVHRGHVEVDDKANKSQVVIAVGQSATVDTQKTDGAIKVDGTGDLPAVVGANGQPVVRTSSSGKGSSGGGSSSGSSGGSSSGVSVSVGPVNVSVGGNSGKGSSNSGSSNSGSSNSGSGNSGNGNSGSGNSGNGGGNGSSGKGNGSSGNSSGKGSGETVSVTLGSIHIGL